MQGFGSDYDNPSTNEILSIAELVGPGDLAMAGRADPSTLMNTHAYQAINVYVMSFFGTLKWYLKTSN